MSAPTLPGKFEETARSGPYPGPDVGDTAELPVRARPAVGDQLAELGTSERAALGRAAEGIGSVPGPRVAARRARRERRFRVRLPQWWPLGAVLVVQAALSLRLVWSNTAFGDEALYLWAGHLEWAHMLHGQRIPAFQTWFSGAPVIYPPIGALADSLGGLTGARILSLFFMLGVTSFLYATTGRLFGRRAAFFAAALFAGLGPTLHLGSFATYDALALLLLSAAAWCATAKTTQADATGWMAAAAVLLTLANATKYATALFDPSVVALAALSGFPVPGGKAALRRGAMVAGLTAALLVALVRVAGSWYADGIAQTTTARALGSDSPLTVLADSARWTGILVALGAIAVAMCALRWLPRRRLLLAAALAGSGLLAPLQQARIHTATSLDKHTDFGAWFAAIAAGWLLAELSRTWDRRAAQAGMVAVLTAGAGVTCAAGLAQARQMIDWPGAQGLISVLRPLTAHGGRFLAETSDVPEYYLPATTWRQWSNTYSITLPDGRVRDINGNAAPYAQAIRAGYFKVVILSYTQTPGIDAVITRYLQGNPGYRMIAQVPFGTNPGSYYVWEYLPQDPRASVAEAGR